MSIAEKLVTIAENQQNVFDAGKKSEYDEFWDLFQDKGNRTEYSNAFWRGFTNVNFKPKYSMSPTVAANMFWGARIKGDLEQILKDCGVTLDFSKATDIRYLFSQCQFTVVPELDFTGCNTSSTANYSSVFGWNNAIETIRKVILPNDGSMGFNYWFSSATNLKNITFEGTIGKTISFQNSTKLSKASIENIVSCLSETATGQTLTFSKTAVNSAFATSTGAADGSTSAEWIALITPKSNSYNGLWTISLV